MRRTILIAIALQLSVSGAGRAQSADKRIAIVVGNNIGIQGDLPLDYAERDAERVHRLLLEVAMVPADRAYLLIGKDAATLQDTINEVVGRLLELRRKGATSVIIYLAAHADGENLHLEGTLFPVKKLRQLVNRMPADLRLVVIDACRTPVLARQRGISRGPAVEVSLDRSEKVEGTVMIHSASFGEPAQEWTFLRGALFTHHLLSGLRGLADIDRNGKVSLAEAYSYAFRKTAAQAVLGRAHGQTPSYEYDIRGIGDWTFSVPEKFGSTLVLSGDLSGTWWIADRKNELVAEIAKTEIGDARVAVIPGWYRVVQPEGAFAWAVDVKLARGEVKHLSRADFVRMPLRKTRLRSSEVIAARPWFLGTSYTLGRGLVDGLGWQHFGGIEVRRMLPNLMLHAALEGNQSRFDGFQQSVLHTELRLRIGVSLVFSFPLGTWSIGLEAQAAGIWQDVSVDRSLAENLGLKDSRSTALALGGGTLLMATVPVWDQLWLSASIGSGVQSVPLGDGGLEWPVYLHIRTTLSYAF